MEALGIIGFFVFIAGIVWLIISFIKRSRKRIPLAVLFVGFIFFVIGASASSTGTIDDSATQSQKDILITTDASAFTLKIEDFSPGWQLFNERSVIDEHQGAQSAYHAGYVKYEFMTTTRVHSTVIIYPTVDMAKIKYEEEKPENISLKHLDIGDEAFCDVSSDSVEDLWFREANVVVSVWTRGIFFDDDAEDYAKVIEKRIDSN